jgi:hypothetical protein
MHILQTRLMALLARRNFLQAAICLQHGLEINFLRHILIDFLGIVLFPKLKSAKKDLLNNSTSLSSRIAELFIIIVEASWQWI